MSDEVEELKRRLEEQIAMIRVPHGPSYRSRRKDLAKIYLESNRQLEGIFNLVESHAVSLTTKTSIRYNQARSDEKESNIGLDGSLVQHGNEYQFKGVPAVLERLYELPECKKLWSVVTRLQSDWLGHWVSLLIGHYAEPELEEQVVSFVDQLLEEIAEGGDNSL